MHESEINHQAALWQEFFTQYERGVISVEGSNSIEQIKDFLESRTAFEYNKSNLMKVKCQDNIERSFSPLIHKYVQLGFNPDLINADMGRLMIDIHPKYKKLSFKEIANVNSTSNEVSCLTHYSKYSKKLNNTTAFFHDVVEIRAYYWFSPCLSKESHRNIYRDDSVTMKIIKYIANILSNKRPSIIEDLTDCFIDKAETGVVYRLKGIQFVSSAAMWILLFEDLNGKLFPIQPAILGCPNLVYVCSDDDSSCRWMRKLENTF